MNFRSTTLVVAALMAAVALVSCRTSSRDDTSSLARLSPVGEAAAVDATTTLPALALATTAQGPARAYERAVAHAALTYELELQTCSAIRRSAREECLATAYEHFADARAKAHAARMAGVAVR